MHVLLCCDRDDKSTRRYHDTDDQGIRQAAVDFATLDGLV